MQRKQKREQNRKGGIKREEMQETGKKTDDGSWSEKGSAQ